jgi:hypothetical protein
MLKMMLYAFDRNADAVREPTIAELLSDPTVYAVMAADRVDPAALEAELRFIASKISTFPHIRGDDNYPAILSIAAPQRASFSSSRSKPRSRW